MRAHGDDCQLIGSPNATSAYQGCCRMPFQGVRHRGQSLIDASVRHSRRSTTFLRSVANSLCARCDGDMFPVGRRLPGVRWPDARDWSVHGLPSTVRTRRSSGAAGHGPSPGSSPVGGDRAALPRPSRFEVVPLRKARCWSIRPVACTEPDQQEIHGDVALLRPAGRARLALRRFGDSTAGVLRVIQFQSERRSERPEVRCLPGVAFEVSTGGLFPSVPDATTRTL